MLPMCAQIAPVLLLIHLFIPAIIARISNSSYESMSYGPYLKYRWQEVVGGPMYTVQMSLIPDEELQSAKTWASVFDEDQGEFEPWPTL